jgi:signal transduction histidine kinase
MKVPSLSARITLLLVATSLLVLGGGARLMDWRIDHDMEARFRENLMTQAQALATVLVLEQDEPGAVPPPQVQTGLLAGEGRAYYEIRCTGQPPLRSTPTVPAPPAGWPTAAASEPSFARLHHGRQSLGTVMYRFTAVTDPASQPAAAVTAPRSCAMLFAQDRKPFDEMLESLDWTLGLSPALALVIALIAVPLIVRRGLRPLSALGERMREIGPNAPGQRLRISGVHELDPLVARFNDVLGRMDEGLARERQFAAGLAHETRTRLAELRALTEVESRYPSGRSLADILGEVGHISGELEATVTALLLLTRLQSGLEQPQRQTLPLQPWLERLLQRQGTLAKQRGIVMQCDDAPSITLHTDPALLEVVLGNLLGNACAYAPEGDTVVVRLDPHGLRIDNAAPGLEPEDLASFGERFWRKQPPHAGHAGLGLALARAAARALGLQLGFTLQDGRLQARLRWD